METLKTMYMAALIELQQHNVLTCDDCQQSASAYGTAEAGSVLVAAVAPASPPILTADAAMMPTFLSSTYAAATAAIEPTTTMPSVRPTPRPTFRPTVSPPPLLLLAAERSVPTAPPRPLLPETADLAASLMVMMVDGAGLLLSEGLDVAVMGNTDAFG
jgi:hypothetical protein